MQNNNENNKERGMIKWMPFAALKEQEELINELINNRNKVSKPLLSDQQLSELDYQVKEAIHNQIEVRIKYFFNYKIHLISGQIIKITNELMVIKSNEKKIKINLDNILEIF